jgi:hypothetical protein
MTRPDLEGDGSFENQRSVDFSKRLRDIELFFEGRDRVHKTQRRVAAKLAKANIPYAVVGGMAVKAHGHEQTTGDVDILLTREGFRSFRRLFVPGAYGPVPNRPLRFLDRRQRTTIDFVITGSFPRDGNPGPIAFPDPAQVCETIAGVRVVNLTTLIQLKLAARRFQDLGDVENLMRVHNLDESFLPRLHPAVREQFLDCLEARRRDDENELRQDRLFAECLRTIGSESRED